MLELKQIKTSYPGFSLDAHLDIPDGQIVALVGPNGSGKTTLIKSILQLIPSNLDGTLFGKRIDELTTAQKEQIGVVFSDSGFNEILKIKQIKKILQGVYSKFDPVYFDRLISGFKLDPQKKISELSHGQRNLLRLSCALAHHPVFLILDEPTNGLDILMRKRILEILQEYVDLNKASILITSHIASDLEHLGDQIVLLKEGKVLFEEEIPNVLEQYCVIKTEKDTLDEYILAKEKTPYGMRYLSNQKAFYKENYPQLVIEDAGLEELEVILFEGERRN